MKVDSEHCPVCGHDVLHWAVTCPGCNQIPWDSPFARKMAQRRRRRLLWITVAGIALPFVLLTAHLIVSNRSLTHVVKRTSQRQAVAGSIEQLQWITGMLHSATPGDAQYQSLLASGEREAAAILADARNPAIDPSFRIMAIASLGSVLSQGGALAAVVEPHRQALVDTLTSISNDPSAGRNRESARVALLLFQHSQSELDKPRHAE